MVEVSHAVDIAMKVVAEGSSGSSDQLVDEVLKRIAERTKANDPAGATREAEEGFARWQKQEAERRASAAATGVTLLEAALKTDLLRFDATAAAERVEKIASLQHEDDPKALFEALRARQDQFYAEGRDKGVNFSLEVAIAIARREVALAHGPDETGVAQNDLGIALETLGERESGTGKLEEAVAAYREALKEMTRERAPLDWAVTQINLGNALQDARRAGERDRQARGGGRGLSRGAEGKDARARAAHWATTQNNLGAALERLGERESGTAQARGGGRGLSRGAEGMDARARAARLGDDAERISAMRSQALGERESGTGKLEEAVAAYREALKEWTRERVPLDWATTQNNLGNALWTLGERESGTGKLEEAVAAYREALKERTRERAPLDWAMTQMNLGNALRRSASARAGPPNSRRRSRRFARR